MTAINCLVPGTSILSNPVISRYGVVPGYGPYAAARDDDGYITSVPIAIGHFPRIRGFLTEVDLAAAEKICRSDGQDNIMLTAEPSGMNLKLDYRRQHEPSGVIAGSFSRTWISAAAEIPSLSRPWGGRLQYEIHRGGGIFLHVGLSSLAHESLGGESSYLTSIPPPGSTQEPYGYISLRISDILMRGGQMENRGGLLHRAAQGEPFVRLLTLTDYFRRPMQRFRLDRNAVVPKGVTLEAYWDQWSALMTDMSAAAEKAGLRSASIPKDFSVDVWDPSRGGESGRFSMVTPDRVQMATESIIEPGDGDGLATFSFSFALGTSAFAQFVPFIDGELAAPLFSPLSAAAEMAHNSNSMMNEIRRARETQRASSG